MLSHVLPTCGCVYSGSFRCTNDTLHKGFEAGSPFYPKHFLKWIELYYHILRPFSARAIPFAKEDSNLVTNKTCRSKHILAILYHFCAKMQPEKVSEKYRTDTKMLRESIFHAVWPEKDVQSVSCFSAKYGMV